MGGRRFVEGLYQAVFSFRLAGRNVIFKAKRKQSLISGSLKKSILMSPTVHTSFLLGFQENAQGRLIGADRYIQ